MNMETTKEANLLGKVLPPRLEDAGLEDCALPPESIKEAFLKAASAVGSRAASIFTTSEDEPDGKEEDGGCTGDPWSNGVASSDALVGIRDDLDPSPGACEAEKGARVPEAMGDDVAAGVMEAEEKATDEVVVAGGGLPEDGRAACVDGLNGLGIGKRGARKGKEMKKRDGEGDEEEERDKGRPILTEGYV